MDSVPGIASPTHPQAAVEGTDLVVDTRLVELITWCVRADIKTLASCQGERTQEAYVLFATLTDLDRFFHELSALAAASEQHQNLLVRLRGIDRRPGTGGRWSYEVAPSYATRQGDPADGLWGIVRFPPEDLPALRTLVAGVAGSTVSRLDQ